LVGTRSQKSKCPAGNCIVYVFDGSSDCFTCYENAIPLSDLNDISQGSISIKELGTKRLQSENIALHSSVRVDDVFFGVNTKYNVSKANATPVEDIDYTIYDGKFTFLTEGTYLVEVTNPAITSTPDFPAKVIGTYIVSGVGIKELSTDYISMYPNPVVDNINIALPENVLQAFFTLCDMQGKTLIRQTVKRQDAVSVNNLASGMYIYTITIEEQHYQGKIIKK
jgi:hypothetical protein